MRQIKPSTSTQFPVGSKVRVLNSGHCYSGYKDMARYMGVDVRIPSNPFLNGEIGEVVAKALHEDGEREVLAVRVERGIGLIDVKGVVEHEELKPIKYRDFVVGQVIRFTSFDHHQHWKFVVGQDYTVVESKFGDVGPANPNGEVPSQNWGDWEWVLVKDVPVIGKGRLPEYELAPVSREVKELTEFFKDAPEWATHVGSDSYGVHYFDHHPHVFQGRVSNGATFLKGMLPDGYKYKSVNGTSKCTDTLKAVVIKRPVKAPEPTIDDVKAELATVKAKLWEAEQKLNKITSLIAG